MTRLDRALGVAAALAVTVGIAWASTVPLTPHGRGDSMLRLAWSARAERLEVCRKQSEEELAKLPVHMRQAEICEGVSARYRLEVRRNEQVIVDQIVQGGGLRHDRPLYVFHEIRQPAGDASFSVQFVRVDAADDPNVRPDPQGRQASDVPRVMRLERRLNLRQGRVLLVTYDPDRRELVAVEELQEH